MYIVTKLRLTMETCQVISKINSANIELYTRTRMSSSPHLLTHPLHCFVCACCCCFNCILEVLRVVMSCRFDLNAPRQQLAKLNSCVNSLPICSNILLVQTLERRFNIFLSTIIMHSKIKLCKLIVWHIFAAARKHKHVIEKLNWRRERPQYSLKVI